jgi:FKBP-type peptidyl-prolyl cis-trans isomerase
MNKLKVLTTILLTAVVLFTVSCGEGGKSGLDGYKKTESGLLYKFNAKGDGTATPVEGDFLDVVMVYGTEDTTLFDSRTIPTREKMSIPMMASVFQGDIYEGLGMMHKGDSASFAMVADSVWLKLFRMPSAPPGLDSLDYLYFHVKLNDILSAEEVQARKDQEMKEFQEAELLARTEYLVANYPDLQPDEKGLYYVRTEKGSGKKPLNGQNVKVHYTGTLLDGTKFDSSYDRGEPYEFPLGQGRVIQGWDLGIAKMQKGEKGVLIIPSNLGYGARGSGKIAPYSTLVFEVELVDISGTPSN